MFESVKLEESSVAYFVIGIQRFNLYKSLNKFNFTLGSEFQKFVKELLISVRNTGNIRPEYQNFFIID